MQEAVLKCSLVSLGSTYLSNSSRPRGAEGAPFSFRQTVRHPIHHPQLAYSLSPLLWLYTESVLYYLLCLQNLIIICLFDRVTARHNLFTLPCCQTYRYLCIMHQQHLRPRYLHGCIPQNGLMQTWNIFALSLMGLSALLKMLTFRQCHFPHLRYFRYVNSLSRNRQFHSSFNSG